MTTQDTRFATRFADMSASTFYSSGVAPLSGYTPSPSPVNANMVGDIGRATIYAAEAGPVAGGSPFARYMKSPLARGEASMVARFSQSTSTSYDPNAGDAVLFATNKRPSMESTVAKKNFSRQVQVEVHDSLMREFVQSESMIGEAAAAIAANANVCYLDDMFAAAVEYYSGSTHGAKSTQMVVLDKTKSEEGFADDLVEEMWNTTNVDFAFKSEDYNKASYNTRANSVNIIMDKNYQYKGFNKLYSAAYHENYIRLNVPEIGYVDSFATTAGKPAGAGDLIAIIADDRAFEITPMPDGLTASSFYNPARLSWMYFLTYQYSFMHAQAFNVKYIFEKGEE